MTTFYWTGGDGTWDAVTTTNWSTTAGSPRTGGAGVPTATDTAIFDSISNGTSYTVTVSNAVVQDTLFLGPATGTVTLAGGARSNLTIYGNLNLPFTGFSTLFAGNLWCAATTTGKTITTNGVVWSSNVWISGVNGYYTLGNAFTTLSSNSIVIENGTLDTAGYPVTTTNIISSGTNTRSLILGASNVTLTGTGTAWSFATTTGLTFNAGTSNIIIASSGGGTFQGGGLTYSTISFTGAPSANNNQLLGANTIGNLKVSSPSANWRAILFNGNTTITGTAIFGSNNTGIRRVRIHSNILNTPFTLTVGTLAAMNDVDFRDVTAAGASAPWSGTRIGDNGGTNNITFDAPKTVYWNLAAGGNWTSTAWALTPTGTPDVNNFPLGQDTIIIGETGLNSGATINTNTSWYIGNVNASTRSTAFTFQVTATPVFTGNLQMGSGATISGTGTIQFSGYNTNQYFETQGLTFDVPISVLAPGSNVIVSNNLVMGSTRTFTLTWGNLYLDGNNLTTGLFSSNNSNARGIRAFNGANITLTGNGGTIWTTSVGTNFSVDGQPLWVTSNYSGATGTRTLTAGTPTAPIVKNRVNFAVTAGTDIVTTGGTTNTGDIDFTGFSGTFNNVARTIYGNLTLSPTMTYQSGATTQTIGGTGDNLTITTNNVQTKFPITVSALLSNVTVQGNLNLSELYTLTLTSGNIFINNATVTAGFFSSSGSSTRSINFGSTGNIVLLGGATTVWNTSTSTGFSVTGVANVNVSNATTAGIRTLSTGTLAENQSVNFVINGSDTIQGLTNARDLDFTGFTGTYQVSAAKTLYGNLMVSPAVTITGYTGAITFASTTSTQRISTQSATIPFPITLNGSTTLQLVDSLTLGAGNTFTLTGGTLDLNGQALNIDNFTTGVGTKSITFNGGSITVTSSSATAWNNANPTGFTSTAGSWGGLIYMTGSTAKTFVGGGATYAAGLLQAGAGNLTITGNNTFTNINTPTTGTHVLFAAGSTTTLTERFSPSGIEGSIVTIASTVSGSPFTLACNVGPVIVRNTLIRDSSATGTASFYAPLSTNGGGNTGWQFQGPNLTINKGITIGAGVRFT